MSAEKLNMVAKISGQHIPFRGTPEAITDVCCSQVAVLCRADQYSDGYGQERACQRGSYYVPNQEPTVAERSHDRRSRLTRRRVPSVGGSFAPLKTPPAIVARLHQEIARATQSSEVKKQYAANGIEDLSMTQPKFAQFIRDEIALSGELAKRANLHSE